MRPGKSSAPAPPHRYVIMITAMAMTITIISMKMKMNMTVTTTHRVGRRVESLVRSSNFKNPATQMTTHGHAWTRKVTSNVTLI